MSSVGTGWRAATRANLAIRALVRQNKPERALAQYLDEYPALTGRTALEWALAHAIGSGTEAVRAPVAWPPALLARSSGAALAFIAAQRSRTSCEPPSALFVDGILPAGLRRILAGAWAEHPQCEALRDRSNRHAFARQLISDASAIEPVLHAVLHLEDTDLAAEVAEQWLRHPLRIERASIGTLQLLARRVAAACREAVDIRLVTARHDAPELVRIAQILATLREHSAVIAASNIAARNGLAPAGAQQLLALRLAALEELDAAGQLVDEYRRDWVPTGARYPSPEQLLYTFHVNGADDAVEHLLASPPESSPRWVHLWKRMIAMRRVSPADLAEWVSLYRESPSDGALLVGLTEAILMASVATRAQERNTVEWVRSVWTKLLGDERAGVLARSYLVLLERVDGDIVSAFHRYFRDGALPAHAARRAAVAYARALGRLREWAQLRAFLDGVPVEQIRLAFGAHELETHALMARLEVLPEDGATSVEEWLAAWERLLALPLDTRSISDALRHFIELSASLRRKASHVVAGEHFEDVQLQVLRRGCAEAERLLVVGGHSTQEIATVRARLFASELAGVHTVIEELRLRNP
jgi:hypothetical protein